MSNSPIGDDVAPVDVMPILVGEDVVRLRQRLREHVLSIKFSLVEQTKFVTAASELARNTLDYGGGGEALIHLIRKNDKQGIAVSFVDQGPGIENVEQALRDGFTSGGGMGLGLGGAKRLADEFYIDTAPGKGTHITIVKWKPF